MRLKKASNNTLSATMNITLLNGEFLDNVGGSGISVFLLASEMVRQGYNANVVTTTYNFKDRYKRITGINVFYVKRPTGVKILRKIKYLFFIQKVIRLIVLSRPDVVYTNVFTTGIDSIWKALKRRNIKVIHILRNHSLLPNNNELKSTRKNIKYHVSSSKIDGVVGISQYILNIYIKNQMFKNVYKTVIMNCVRICNHVQLRNIHNTTKNKKMVFGFIGRLEKRKGIEMVFYAANNLDYKIMIMGENRSNYNLSQYRNIEYLEYKTDTSSFYSRIDCLLFPSIFDEPFGRSIIEAFSYGKPVIGSNIGGINEIIKDGYNGWLSIPNNCDDLLKKMQYVISLKQNKMQEIQRNCIKDVKSRFYPKDIVKQLIEFTESV